MVATKDDGVREQPRFAQLRGEGLGQANAVIFFPILLSLILTATVYSATLGASFMLDDPMDLPRASGRAFVEILTSAGESNYYRPISLVIWKVAYVLLGRHDPVVLHAILLAVHAVNGWLVYQLGSRLADRTTGLLAMAFFILFPLNYQVVSIVNAFFHALVTMWVILATIFYWQARCKVSAMDGRRYLGAALIAAAFGMLTHENGLAVVAGVLGVEGVLRVSGRVARLSLAPALFITEAVAFFGLYWIVPRWQTSWTLDPESLRQNGLFFVQGLVYPVAGQLGALPGWFGSEARLLIAATAITLLIITVVMLSRRRFLVFVFAIGWFTVAVIPSWVVLRWGYVIDGPRLLYLASVGIALLWGAALAPRMAAGRNWGFSWHTLANMVRIGIASAILIWSGHFVAERVTLQSYGTAIVNELAATATRTDGEAGRIYVNFPSWLSFRERSFPKGNSGIPMIPQYIGLGRSVYVHTGKQPDLISIAYPEVAREWDHHFGFHGDIVDQAMLAQAFHQGGGVYLTSFVPGHLTLRYVGQVNVEAATRGAPLARFGDWAQLEDARVRIESNHLVVDLVWSAITPVPSDYTIFVHLVGDTPSR